MTVVYLTCMALTSLFGLAVLAVTVLAVTAGLMARWGRKHPAPAERTQPGPGPNAGAGEGLPPADAQAPPHLRAPAPALTKWETGVLNGIANADTTPFGRQNGRELADIIRKCVPHLSDVDIARVILHIYWTTAAFQLAMPPGYAEAATIETLGGAACELTDLERNEVPS